MGCTKTSINDIPIWILEDILLSLSFPNLLSAHATCRQWNSITHEQIGQLAILNIKMDKSRASKQFRRGKWNPSLIGDYEEIRVIPKRRNAFIFGKALTWHTSSLQHFSKVVKLTVFENGSFLHFIHRYMALLPNVKYVQLRELKYDESSADYGYSYSSVRQAYSRVTSHETTWFEGMENVLKLETLRIRLYDRLATLIYMNLFTFRTCSLANLELDFSKLFGLPLVRSQLNEIYSTMTTMMEYCHETLKQLRIKWAIRVETELDFTRSDEDVEPFIEFMLALRNPVWKKLHLQQLFLSFPNINFGFSICDATLIPFLQDQEATLKRVSFARVTPGVGIADFLRNFPSTVLHKFEFGFHFNNFDLSTPQPVSVIRGVELLVVEGTRVDLPTIARVNRGRRENGLKYYMNLKILNAQGNFGLAKPDMVMLTDYFHTVRTLELIDNCGANKLQMQFTDQDFNLIMRRMSKLMSLKMSNASKLTDMGLTKIPEERVRYMKFVGAYYRTQDVEAPVAKAKSLRYLDLRDLPPTVSDISVFFGFQHIKKLEKISFHGAHYVILGQADTGAEKSQEPIFSSNF
ncbi:hypothetical protein Ocin01_10598 [Orchesella cincta]|uniref:F-box domain-containing protein n=1 Tax=Orchesella cincta TaxID=48709 RepID=A0A1D2MT23_ORCCI|nr:hypothetical protein Ocin01_10598 [Orchesella cincta]